MAKKPIARDEDHIKELKDAVKSMGGLDAVMMGDLLDKYDALNSVVNELQAIVLEEGAMVEVMRGGANNRHKEKVENPALTAYSKAVGRLGDLAKKISGFAKGDTSVEDEDELVAFNRR